MFKSKSVGITTKIIILKIKLRLVVIYGAEPWTLTKRGKELAQRWELKILRKMYRAVKENEIWRIRKNNEFHH